MIITIVKYQSPITNKTLYNVFVNNVLATTKPQESEQEASIVARAYFSHKAKNVKLILQDNEKETILDQK